MNEWCQPKHLIKLFTQKVVKYILDIPIIPLPLPCKLESWYAGGLFILKNIDTLAIHWKVKKSWKNSFSADSRTFDSRRKSINMIIPSVIEVVAMTSIVINTSWFVLIRFIWHLRSHNLWMVQEVISWSTWIWRVHLAWASVHFKQLHWIRS